MHNIKELIRKYSDEKLKNAIMALEKDLKQFLDENGSTDYLFCRNNKTREIHICNYHKDNKRTLCSENIDDGYEHIYPGFTENDIRLISGYLEKKHINGYGDIHICGTCISSLYGDKDY